MTNRTSILMSIAALLGVSMGARLFRDEQGGIQTTGPGRRRRGKFKPSHFANRGRRGCNRRKD